MQTSHQLGKGEKYRSVLGTLVTVYRWVSSSYFSFVLSSPLGTVCKVNIYRNEGIYRGWYKGLSMNMIKGPLAVSLAYTTNDYLKIALQWLFQEIQVER